MTKNTKKEQQVFEIYLGYDEHSSGGEICRGQENISYPSRTDTNVEFTPEGLYTKKGSGQCTLRVPFDPKTHVGQKVYMVLVRYSDGDTFGRTNGLWKIMGVFLTQVEADFLKKDINKNVKQKERKKGDEWRPWFGYFASFESVEIWGTEIKDDVCSGIRWF